MMTDTATTDRHAERALVTAQEIRLLAVEFIGAMQDAGRLAAALADAEARHRAALSAAGVPHCHRPPARELAAEIALGYLEPLSPYVSMVTASSRDRAAATLTSMPCATLPTALEEPCPF